VFLIVFSFVSSKLNKNFLSVVGQDIKSWFQSAMILPGLHERRVCSFGRDQISCKLLHLYERRVCSFDRNQMVQILILLFTLNVRLLFACSDGHKILNLNLLGVLQFTHVQISY
jgi:hypothetical protein